MIQKLKSKLSLLRRKTISREIDGANFTFHPVSLGMFFDLKTVFEPMWLAVQNLVSKHSNDVQNTIETIKRPDGSIETVTHIGSISIEMAQFRKAQSDAAVRAVVQSLLSPESRLGVGRIFADLLRDDFGPNPSDDDILEFMDGVDIPLAFELLGGFVEVNASMLAPFIGRIKAFMADRFGTSPEILGPKLSKDTEQSEADEDQAPTE